MQAQITNKPAPPPPPATVTLTMTFDEAAALSRVLGREATTTNYLAERYPDTFDEDKASKAREAMSAAYFALREAGVRA